MKRPPQIQFRLDSEARSALESIRKALARELGRVTLNKAARLLYDHGLRAIQVGMENGRNIFELLSFRLEPAGQRQLLGGEAEGMMDKGPPRVLEHVAAGIDRLTDENERLRARLRETEDILGRLVEWTHEYGKSLCPTGVDTYGEGVRACKRQVSNIIDARGATVPEEEP